MSDAVSAKVDAQEPSLPPTWYAGKAAAEAAQVERECAMAVPLHHVEVMAHHEGSFQDGTGPR
jgi:hypothetical protein